MNKLSYAVNRFVEFEVWFCYRMLLILGLAMTLLILLQVFFRFVIYVPFPWSEECARYLMIWMGMLGSVIALKAHRHIGVMFFVEKMAEKYQKGIWVLVQVGMAFFLGILCWQGILFSMFNVTQTSPAMNISMLIPFSAIPTGAAMMILVIAADLLEYFFPVTAVVTLEQV